MSYVGGKYEYDLFISYAHGVAATDPEYDNKNLLRGWSCHLAKLVAASLRTVLNAGQPADRRFNIYLDEREFDSGEDISAKLRAAAEKSAVLLILMSPYYLESFYCREEVKAFFDSRPEPDLCLIREIMPTINLDHLWPSELRSDCGKAVNRGNPFYSPVNQLPINLMQYSVQAPTPDLADPADILSNTIKKRLQKLRKKTDAETKWTGGQILERPSIAIPDGTSGTAPAPAAAPSGGNGRGGKRPPKVPLYLQAESRNREAWLGVRRQLEHMALINPQDLEPGEEELPLIATYYQRRLKMLQFCQGLLLLRARDDDDIELQLMAASHARSTVWQEWQRLLPWAVIDDVDRDEPFFSRFEITRVPTTRADWPKLVFEELGLAAVEGS